MAVVHGEIKQLAETHVIPPVFSSGAAGQLNNIMTVMFQGFGVQAVPIQKSETADDFRSSEEYFQQLISRILENDPTLTMVNTHYLPMDDERTIHLLKTLEKNTHVTSLIIQGENGVAKFTEKSYFYFKKYLEKTKTLQTLKLCQNQIDINGALPIFEGLLHNDSLTNICLCNNPIVKRPLNILCAGLARKPKIMAGLKANILHYLNQRLTHSSDKAMSPAALQEYLTKNPKAFVTLFAETEGKFGYKSSRFRQYSPMTECYCVPQMSRFLDSPNAPDYRKMTEDRIVDYYCAKYPNKNVTLKFVSVGAGNFLQDAVIVAKLFAAGFKNFNWSLVDLDFNSARPLLQHNIKDAAAMYQFLRLMQDLGLRCTNGSLFHNNLAIQNAAFELFKQRTRPLKHPKGNICVSTYPSVETYCADIEKNPRAAPHAILTLDLNESTPDAIVGPIKKIAAEGTLHFNMEKNLSNPAKIFALLDLQLKSKDKWEHVTTQCQTELTYTPTGAFPSTYYNRHLDSYKMTLRREGDHRIVEQDKPMVNSQLQHHNRRRSWSQ